ncbi:hypothetical protein ZOSMA_401G00180 [Zostera marina]|uniref:Uncharacterized protein n=1 Tax=Zostera marina TaxID=29655 RepID=A0A0K9P3E5_ZOSMR|nr:hypothetical protein ZOSMA_401G00180 [Zostera marina]
MDDPIIFIFIMCSSSSSSGIDEKKEICGVSCDPRRSWSKSEMPVYSSNS